MNRRSSPIIVTLLLSGVTLLGACGDDGPPAKDVASVELFWATMTPAEQNALCDLSDETGAASAARAWEESWNGSGETDDAAVEQVVADKC